MTQQTNGPCSGPFGGLKATNMNLSSFLTEKGTKLNQVPRGPMLAAIDA